MASKFFKTRSPIQGLTNPIDRFHHSLAETWIKVSKVQYRLTHRGDIKQA